VLRRSRPPPVFALAAGAILTAQACMSGVALTQTADPGDRPLIRPALDVDPRNPRARQTITPPTDPTAPRIGEIPSFDYRTGLGAGATGFNSAAPARKKAKRAAKKAGQTQTTTTTVPGAPLTLTPSSSASALPSSQAPSAPTPPPPLPAPLPPNGAIPSNVTAPSAVVARAPQYLARRGGPNYTGGTATLPIDPDDPLALPAPPAQPLRQLLRDPNPFDPVGLSVGAFTFRPALEIQGGFDTNAARTPAKTPSWFETVAPELLVNSNWQRHSLTATLRGSYSWFNDAPELDRPAFEGRINGIVDVSRDTRLNLESHYIVATDYPGSPNLQVNLARFPIDTTIGGIFGVEQRFNRVEVAVKGLIDRTAYQNSHFTDGSTSSNDDRNYNRYGGEARLAYDLMPGLKPFLEFGADTRIHDLKVDRNNLMRDSDGFFARGGSTFEFSSILTGDMAVGWLTRSYQDPTLPNLNGVTIDGTLTWLASALTTVKLITKTIAQESTVAGTAGEFTREAGIEIDHAFRQWLIGTLRFTYDNDNYVGSTRNDNRYTAAAAITYKLSREWQVKGEYRREWLRSTAPGVDYLSNVFLLGVRMQK
jgi:hypothetical protein